MDEYELQEQQITQALDKYRKSRDLFKKIEAKTFTRKLFITWTCTISSSTKILLQMRSINGTQRKSKY